MALNYIWIAFFFIAFITGCIKLIFLGDTQVFPAMMKGTFDAAKTGFELSIGLTGVLTLWLGFMKIGENGGVINILSRWVGPLFRKLFPDLPEKHPAIGSMVMNFSANLLGLSNAATPMGLKAMTELQEANPNKDKASSAMIMFLAINTAGFSIMPVTIMAYRAQAGAKDPSDVLIPIILATFCSTVAGILFVSIRQRINLLNRTVLAYFGAIALVIGAIVFYFSHLPKERISEVSAVAANFLLFLIIISFIGLGIWKKTNIFNSFIDGAKEGFQVAIKVIPYLIAILVGIKVFRESGALGYIIQGAEYLLVSIGLNTDFVPALPVAFMKPLSGSGASGLMIDTMKNLGADSFAGRVACAIQGAADTTFYILAVYFGSVGIKQTRYALWAGLFTDFVGIIAAILICYLFFA